MKINNTNIKEKENNTSKLSLEEKKDLFNSLKEELNISSLKSIKSEKLILIEETLRLTLRNLSSLRLIKKELIASNTKKTNEEINLIILNIKKNFNNLKELN